MLPYFDRITYAVGPLTLHVWGLFIALGLLAMLWLLKKECAARKLNFDVYVDMALWTMLAAFVGARLSHVFLYEPGYYLSHPAEIIRVWEGGMSSLGGIVFGTAAALVFVWRKKLSFTESGDAIFRSMPAAWAIGRFGCYLTHMHPGLPSTFFLAVNYPGGPRLDLGLLESLFWFILLATFWCLRRSSRRGFYMTIVPLAYAPVRFVLDFLRAHDSSMSFMSDTRYAGLTPAQYGMILLFIIGLGLAFHYFYDARRHSKIS